MDRPLMNLIEGQRPPHPVFDGPYTDRSGESDETFRAAVCEKHLLRRDELGRCTGCETRGRR